MRLPPGRHGLPRAFVAENQRERLLNGVVEAVAEHGYNATTIGQISAAASNDVYVVNWDKSLWERTGGGVWHHIN